VPRRRMTRGVQLTHKRGELQHGDRVSKGLRIWVLLRMSLLWCHFAASHISLMDVRVGYFLKYIV
jgi:hypothetical protein